MAVTFRRVRPPAPPNALPPPLNKVMIDKVATAPPITAVHCAVQPPAQSINVTTFEDCSKGK